MPRNTTRGSWAILLAGLVATVVLVVILFEWHERAAGAYPCDDPTTEEIELCEEEPTPTPEVPTPEVPTPTVTPTPSPTPETPTPPPSITPTPITPTPTSPPSSRQCDGTPGLACTGSGDDPWAWAVVAGALLLGGFLAIGHKPGGWM